MAGDFGGETAAFYARFRRGYPAAFTGLLTRALRLGPADALADVGCGSGQLTLPLARQVQAVAGIDPEPDMLALGRQAAAEQGVTNVTWVAGTDRDLPGLAALIGYPAVSWLIYQSYQQHHRYHVAPCGSWLVSVGSHWQLRLGPR